MSDERLGAKIEHTVTLFKQSRYAVAFSGAGISTDSGIPDFRSPDSGLWENVDPFAVASIYGFKRNPQEFYDWLRPLTHLMAEAKPNSAHLALAELEKKGYLRDVITQNIDALHTRAGNQRVFELHGHLREATCIHCFAVYDGDKLMRQFMQDGLMPRCPKCQSAIKPNVVLFGEQLPIRELHGARDSARKCDLMLVVGSSLTVAPANELPFLAKRNGARLIILNLEATHLDYMADVVIHERAAITLPEITRQLETKL